MSVSAQAPDSGRNKSLHLSKHDLSARRAGLLELMQSINFGRIEGLAVLDGEPVLDPPPRVIREVKFGGENGPRPEAALADFREDPLLYRKRQLGLVVEEDRPAFQVGLGASSGAPRFWWTP